MTNTQSEFGAQYDSLSDMVSFGVAPALVMYLWAFGDMGRVGLFAAFVHTAGAALSKACGLGESGGRTLGRGEGDVGWLSEYDSEPRDQRRKATRGLVNESVSLDALEGIGQVDG